MFKIKRSPLFFYYFSKDQIIDKSSKSYTRLCKKTEDQTKRNLII
jgi:hypothetical protein